MQEVLCNEYELRYNLLSEQSEYHERGSQSNFLPITKRVYMTWLMDIQAQDRTDAVYAVPLRQSGEVLRHGMIRGDV